MPGPEVCNLIEDPDEQERCLNYEGEYAKKEINENYIRHYNYSSCVILFVWFMMKERIYFVLVMILIQMILGYGFGNGSFCYAAV